MNIQTQTDGNHNRRMANEARFLARRETLEDKAEKMLGELNREGKTVYYIFPEGGKYQESQSASKLIDFLIRNKYVR